MTAGVFEPRRGRKFAPLLPFYPPAVLSTFPALYELLLRNRHRRVLWVGDASRLVADITDSALW